MYLCVAIGSLSPSRGTVMLQKIHGIVLSVVRHSDRHNVVTLYTPERGRIAFLVPAGGASASARSRRALLQPLSLIEAEVRLHSGRELIPLSRFAPGAVLASIYFDPLKRTVAFFLAEFLGRLLRDSPPDMSLWNYITASLRAFDAMRRGAGNFHILFIWGILPYAGIRPDMESWRPGAVFDMREGRFTLSLPLHSDWLAAEEAAVMPLLDRLTPANCHRWRTTGANRSRILAGMLRYMAIHFPGMASLKSADILRSLNI